MKKKSAHILSFQILHRVKTLLFFTPSLLLLFLISVLVLITAQLRKQIAQEAIMPTSFASYKAVDYPRIPYSSNIMGNTLFFGDFTAQGAVVMDSDSKIILMEKNPEKRFSMASTTKIMTALVGLEHYKLDDILTVQSTFTEGATVGLTAGEHLRFIDVLYAMLLPSGNDAATAIAQNYPSGEAAFVAAMNDKAAELSLPNTHFADPTGLTDRGDYTTAYELARLASVAIKNDTLSQVVSTKTKIIANLDNTKIYTLYNLNILLGKYGVVGVKTGFTPEAGGILVTEKNDQGHRTIIVVMKSEDRFADTEKLLSLLEGNITYQSIRF